MRLISFFHEGSSTYGLVLGHEVLNLGPILGSRAADLKTLLGSPELLAEVPAEARARQPDLRFSDLTLLPVIPNPGQIFCIGLNYADHVQEVGREVTRTPVIFLRVPQSQVGHGQSILLPPESQMLDYEGEIAVVIGKGGRRIREEDAYQHVAGYACYNDGSIRDWQTATSQWTPGKNFYGTGAFGPWLVTADEIPPGKVMRLQTLLNGAVVQETTTDRMVHSIARQIAYVSTFTPLAPGDVIVTGTPGGVGMKRTPPLFMKDGDVCEVAVDAIGTLLNPIRREREGIA